jgi:hypothetical protein
MMVKIVKELVEEIVGSDGKIYGPFKKGEIAEIPNENARLLIDAGFCEKVKNENNDELKEKIKEEIKTKIINFKYNNIDTLDQEFVAAYPEYKQHIGIVRSFQSEILAELIEKKKKEEKEKLRHLKIETLLSKEKPIYKSLGMGIHNGVFYFGVKIYDEEGKPHDAVVTSDKKIYVDWGSNDNEIKNKFGLNYRWPFFDDLLKYSWSNKSIKNWLYGDVREITLKEAFEKIKEKNKKYIWYLDPRRHDFVALDILSTYFLEIFETKGRTLIKGEMGSGKSMQCHIYELLSFNSILSNDLTKASIFRAVESTKGTIIIDDFDREVPEELKNDILIIFKAYRKGMKSIRVEGEKSRKPQSYDTFCSMILNNISGLDEVSESRCNIIKMLRNEKMEKAEKIKFDDPEWQELRNELYICALQNWEKVKGVYEQLKEKRLKARNLEVVEPHLTLARLIDEKLYEDIINLKQEEIDEKKVRDLNDNYLYLGMKFILTQLSEKGEPELWIRVKDIASYVISELFYDIEIKDEMRKKKEKSVATFLGKVLKANPLFKGRMNGGYAEYCFKRNNVLRFCEIKEFDDLVVNYQDVEQKGIKKQTGQVELVELENQALQSKIDDSNLAKVEPVELVELVELKPNIDVKTTKITNSPISDDEILAHLDKLKASGRNFFQTDTLIKILKEDGFKKAFNGGWIYEVKPGLWMVNV